MDKDLQEVREQAKEIPAGGWSRRREQGSWYSSVG